MSLFLNISSTLLLGIVFESVSCIGDCQFTSRSIRPVWRDEFLARLADSMRMRKRFVWAVSQCIANVWLRLLRILTAGSDHGYEFNAQPR